MEGSFRWKYPSTVLNAAGNFTYDVVFTPSDTVNYASATFQVTVNVNKKLVTVPTIASVVYNGLPQSPNISDTDEYRVTTKPEKTDAGSYRVVLELKDSQNFQWADGDTNTTKKLLFTIEPAPLNVSTGYSVERLGYGQQLRPGIDEAADDRYQTANEIIKNANVTMSNGTPVAGYWEWSDFTHAPDYGKTLYASASGDNEDFGDGYDVTAVFHPTSVTESNFIQLTHQFHVEVDRATPDYEDCKPYLKQGAIFQPASGTKVNKLSDFTPVLTNLPVNPVTREPVQGRLYWEADKYPDKTDDYSLKFEPNGLYLDYEGMFIKNYADNVIIPVHVEVKNSIDITFSIADGQKLLYSGYTPNSNLVSTRTVQWSPSVETNGYMSPFAIQFAMDYQYYPQVITLSSDGKTVMKNTYGYDVDVDSLILTKSIGDGNEYHPAFSLDDKMMENGVYKITFERDGAVDYWMRKDISVVIQTAQKPST